MFELCAEKTKLSLSPGTREQVTSGSVAVYRTRFEFSPDWDGLEKVACFKSGAQIISVLLDDTNECVIPWEVTDPDDAGKTLFAGVYGTKGGSVVLPTIWTNLGTILPGTSPGETARPPTPDLWEQELARKGDALDYDGLNLSLMSGDKPLSTVQVAGGGEGGTTDHRALTHRGDAAQHPIGAIEGLADELNRIPGPVEALTNLELEEILK